MIQIPCPHCGPRNVSEYRYVGEPGVRPPEDPADPVAWRSYLYLRTNAAGWVTETWLHRAGCRQYLGVERNTLTNEVGDVRVSGARREHPAGIDTVSAAADPAGNATADEGGVL